MCSNVWLGNALCAVQASIACIECIRTATCDRGFSLTRTRGMR